VHSRLRRILTIGFVTLAAAALVAWAVRDRPPDLPPAGDSQPPTPPVPVVLATASEAENAAELDVVGSGLAARSVTLFAAVPGEVEKVSFSAGRLVREGQILLRLVDRKQRLALDLAAARLEAAQRLLARYESTRGTGAVPGSVIDEAQSGVRLAEIEVRQAREALADRVVRAPFAGVVGLTGIEPGDRIAIDTPITTLDDRRSLRVNFELPEVYAARLKIGQPITVTNPAYGARRFEGRIAQIDSRIDETSRNLRVRASVPNKGDVLRPGMSFQVRLTLPGAVFVAVPELAVQWGREGSFVWTVREGKAVQVPVRTIRREADRVLVEGALRTGAPIVIEGVQRLRAGRAVVDVGGDPVEAAARSEDAAAVRTPR
jgi:RND family efflux transporter MFP subunit